MLTRLAVATVLSTLPTLAGAQGAAPTAAVSDGSEIRHAEQTRAVGHALLCDSGGRPRRLPRRAGTVRPVSRAIAGPTPSQY